MKQRRYDDAIVEFEKAVKMNPENDQAHYTLGWLYIKQNMLDKGLEENIKVIKLNPEHKLANYNLACIYSLMEKKDESINALSRTLGFGLRDFELIDTDKDLDFIRNDERFIRLIESYRK